MKKIYSILFVSFLLAGCSKDFLKSYENRIEGVWRLVDVDRRGFGGSISQLPFQSGQFTFRDGGQLDYQDDAGNLYEGSWDIRREWVSGNCNGNNCDDRQVKALNIVAINFLTQEIRSEYFEEMQFTGTDRFNAYIYSGAHTYIFRFRR